MKDALRASFLCLIYHITKNKKVREAVMFAYMAYLNPGDEARLAYVLNKEDLGKALVVLEKALDEYGRR